MKISIAPVPIPQTPASATTRSTAARMIATVVSRFLWCPLFPFSAKSSSVPRNSSVSSGQFRMCSVRIAAFSSGSIRIALFSACCHFSLASSIGISSSFISRIVFPCFAAVLISLRQFGEASAVRLRKKRTIRQSRICTAIFRGQSLPAGMPSSYQRRYRRSWIGRIVLMTAAESRWL